MVSRFKHECSSCQVHFAIYPRIAIEVHVHGCKGNNACLLFLHRQVVSSRDQAATITKTQSPADDIGSRRALAPKARSSLLVSETNSIAHRISQVIL